MLKSIFRTAAMTSGLIVAGVLTSSQPLAAADADQLTADTAMQNGVTAEMMELRSLLHTLNSHADHLKILTNLNLNWDTHVFHLNQVKDAVNRVGEQLELLRNMRVSAASWQQEAFDSVFPVAAEVAERTSRAIEHLSEQQQHLWAPQYMDHLQKISTLSDQMYDVVDNHLKIVDVRERLERMQQKLGDRAS